MHIISAIKPTGGAIEEFRGRFTHSAGGEPGSWEEQTDRQIVRTLGGREGVLAVAPG